MSPNKGINMINIQKQFSEHSSFNNIDIIFIFGKKKKGFNSKLIS